MFVRGLFVLYQLLWVITFILFIFYWISNPKDNNRSLISIQFVIYLELWVADTIYNYILAMLLWSVWLVEENGIVQRTLRLVVGQRREHDHKQLFMVYYAIIAFTVYIKVYIHTTFYKYPASYGEWSAINVDHCKHPIWYSKNVYCLNFTLSYIQDVAG